MVGGCRRVQQTPDVWSLALPKGALIPVGAGLVPARHVGIVGFSAPTRGAPTIRRLPGL
jgi:hypothetical protein